jgi:hypothetical protein
MHVLYLHGFASSPHSTKAAKVAERLAAHGLAVHCPDFNAPDFSTLTVTRMIDQTRDAIAALPPAPVVLIGSSLGGFVAVHVAALPPPSPASRVDRLVLLAPALDFGRSRLRHLGPDGLDRWRETNRLDVFHYGYEKVMPLQYSFQQDSERYDAFGLTVNQPMLVFQGRRDEAVDPAMVERYAREHPNVILRLLDDDHQMVASVPRILDGIETFLGLGTR